MSPILGTAQFIFGMQSYIKIRDVGLCAVEVLTDVIVKGQVAKLKYFLDVLAPKQSGFRRP
jgi:hypothetical protein